MNELSKHDVGRLLADAVPPLREPEDRIGEVATRVRRDRLRAGVLALGGMVALAIFVVVVPQLADRTRSADPTAEVRYSGTVLVLDTADDVPRLCPAVWAQLPLAPYPPAECPGPLSEVVGWHWAEVAGEETVGATTLGTFDVVGTWDGERFRLTEPAVPGDAGDTENVPGSPDSDTSTPCPEPEGGWQPVDRSKATDEALNAALDRARSSPSFGEAWLDQSYMDAYGSPPAGDDRWNDPTRLVLNLAFTESLAEQEQWIREVWGGPLCVSAVEHTHAELSEVQQSILDGSDPNMLSAHAAVRRGAVVVEALFATPDLQARLDERYGPGLVVVEGWLEPVS